ncbi:MAG: type II secretion system minor pseudopilin GspH [Pseudomonadota bacterium]
MIRRGPSRRRTQGFTLIEVLLVVVLIAVLMGVAVVSLNPEDPERRLLRAREQMQGQLALARVIAERDQLEIGVRLLPGSWQFLRFRSTDRQWEIMADEPAFKVKPYTGLALSWQDADAKATAVSNERKGLIPDFMLMSSGEATPGIIRFDAANDARGLQESLTLTDIGDAVATELLTSTVPDRASSYDTPGTAEAARAPR